MKGKATKHWFLRWVWRVQQVGAITSLVLMALTYTTVLSDKIQWRFESLYVSYLFTLGLLGGTILTVAYLWDAKGKFWIEQGEVLTERNPYMMYHMTAKEIVTNFTMWIPLFLSTGNIESARVMEDWCRNALKVDPKVKPRCDELIKEFKVGGFVKERYPWYG